MFEPLVIVSIKTTKPNKAIIEIDTIFNILIFFIVYIFVFLTSLFSSKMLANAIVPDMNAPLGVKSIEYITNIAKLATNILSNINAFICLLV